jgi:branched-chain amino acid transport system ATP-binding protein
LAALRIVGLVHRAEDRPGDLPYGQQRLVEIARALATSPKVLLLDEPAAGMNPTEKGGLLRLIRRLNVELGYTVLLVEHDMNVVMGCCAHITVLNFGSRIAHGTAAEVRSDPAVIQAYLGTGGGQHARRA